MSALHTFPQQGVGNSLLPVELLLQIFHADESDIGALIRLGWVCRLWRDTIAAEPSLWTRISVNFPGAADLVEYQLERSGTCDLRVQVSLQPEEFIAYNAVVVRVLEQYERISHLEIRAAHNDFEGWIVVLPGQLKPLLEGGRTWPRLQTLLAAHLGFSARFALNIVAPNIVSFRAHFPHDNTIAHLGGGLRDLQVVDMDDLDAFSQPIRRSRWPGLRRLSINTYSIGPAFTPALAHASFLDLHTLHLYLSEVDSASFIAFLSGCSNALKHLWLFTTQAPPLEESSVRRSDMRLRLQSLALHHQAEYSFSHPLALLAPYIDASHLQSLELHGNSSFNADDLIPLLHCCSSTLAHLVMRGVRIVDISTMQLEGRPSLRLLSKAEVDFPRKSAHSMYDQEPPRLETFDADQQRMMELLLSFLPLSCDRLRSVSLSTLPIPPADALRVLSNASHGPLELAVPRLGFPHQSHERLLIVQS